LAPNGGKTGNDLSVKDKSILDHVEKIVEIFTKNSIEKYLSEGRKHLDYVSKKMGINYIQAVLFSHFMEKSDYGCIRISEIAETIKCSKVRIIKYMNECEELGKKKLIRCSRNGNDVSYRIPHEVSDSLRKYNKFRPEKLDNLTMSKFFVTLEKVFDEMGNSELTYDTMKMEIKDLINQNMHLVFCRKIMSYNLYEDDLILLVCFCHFSGNNDDDNIGMYDIKFLFDDTSAYYEIKGYYPV